MTKVEFNTLLALIEKAEKELAKKGIKPKLNANFKDHILYHQKELLSPLSDSNMDTITT